MTYIFSHVPKCGGTSLLKSLEESTLNTYIDYDAWVGPAMSRRNREASNLDFSSFDLVYGHFPIARYDRPEYKYIALVRDPLERAVSHYHHIQRRWEKGIPLSKPYAIMAEGLSKGTLTFLDCLDRDPFSRSIYKHFLGYWDASRFSLIGWTDQYDKFLEDLADLLGVEFVNDKHERKSSRTYALSDDERESGRKLLASEYEWFDQFVQPILPVVAHGDGRLSF